MFCLFGRINSSLLHPASTTFFPSTYTTTTRTPFVNYISYYLITFNPPYPLLVRRIDFVFFEYPLNPISIRIFFGLPCSFRLPLSFSLSLSLLWWRYFFATLEFSFPLFFSPFFLIGSLATMRASFHFFGSSHLNSGVGMLLLLFQVVFLLTTTIANNYNYNYRYKNKWKSRWKSRWKLK